MRLVEPNAAYRNHCLRQYVETFQMFILDEYRFSHVVTFPTSALLRRGISGDKIQSRHMYTSIW